MSCERTTSLKDLLPGGLGEILGGAAAGTALSGGLGALIKEFQQGGLGQAAQSWVGTGPNQKIASNNLARVLGTDTLDALSKQTGVKREDAASGVPEGDSYTIAVAHKLGDRVVVDAIREVRPPFSAFEVINTVLLPLCKAYSIHSIVGDNYAGELAKEPVRAAGISYELSKKHKSELYIDPFLPMLNARKIDIPRNERAVNQICSLERSVQRSGRDRISHPTHGRDDVANAIAGAVDVAANFVLFDQTWSWVDGVGIGQAETDEQRRARQKKESEDWYAARLRGYLAMHGAFGWPPFP
jgi:hypothetical protein